MLVIGIDYSITSPAICVFDGNKPQFSFSHCHHYSLNPHKNIQNTLDNIHFSNHKDYTEQIERYDHISSWAMRIIHEYDSNDIDMVGIEGYAMGAKGQVFNIGENTGILKYRLHESGIRQDVVAPTVVKKFATGKGSGKKDAMYDAFVKDTGLDLKVMIQPNRLLGSPTTDIVDAFYICKYFFDQLK